MGADRAEWRGPGLCARTQGEVAGGRVVVVDEEGGVRSEETDMAEDEARAEPGGEPEGADQVLGVLLFVLGFAVAVDGLIGDGV